MKLEQIKENLVVNQATIAIGYETTRLLADVVDNVEFFGIYKNEDNLFIISIFQHNGESKYINVEIKDTDNFDSKKFVDSIKGVI